MNKKQRAQEGRQRTIEQERLQAIANDLRDPDKHDQMTVEYRGSVLGWWLDFEHPRHFNDNGEFLGYTEADAIASLHALI